MSYSFFLEFFQKWPMSKPVLITIPSFLQFFIYFFVCAVNVTSLFGGLFALFKPYVPWKEGTFLGCIFFLSHNAKKVCLVLRMCLSIWKSLTSFKTRQGFLKETFFSKITFRCRMLFFLFSKVFCNSHINSYKRRLNIFHVVLCVHIRNN